MENYFRNACRNSAFTFGRNVDKIYEILEGTATVKLLNILENFKTFFIVKFSKPSITLLLRKLLENYPDVILIQLCTLWIKSINKFFMQKACTGCVQLSYLRKTREWTFEVSRSSLIEILATPMRICSLKIDIINSAVGVQ